VLAHVWLVSWLVRSFIERPPLVVGELFAYGLFCLSLEGHLV